MPRLRPRGVVNRNAAHKLSAAANTGEMEWPELAGRKEKRQSSAISALGMMGLPTTRRLVNAGYDVTVWNRSPGKAAVLVEAGAALVAKPPAVGDAPSIVFMCLTDASAVEQVVDIQALSYRGWLGPRLNPSPLDLTRVAHLPEPARVRFRRIDRHTPSGPGLLQPCHQLRSRGGKMGCIRLTASRRNPCRLGQGCSESRKHT
jgi:hypothetical protein